MSHIATVAPTASSKVVRLTTAVRRSWTEARRTDRQLMELRTHLSRVVG